MRPRWLHRAAIWQQWGCICGGRRAQTPAVQGPLQPATCAGGFCPLPERRLWRPRPPLDPGGLQASLWHSPTG
eukprot:726648-Lingulodinium_polyedra.AAC.1